MELFICRQRTGIAEVGEFEIRLPTTEAKFIKKC
jgi:hypothetical protein